MGKRVKFLFLLRFFSLTHWFKGSEQKRHPLLRDVNLEHSGNSGSELEASIVVSQLKYRAKLDAIRGPPVMIVNKMPDNLGTKPEVIRGSIKNGVQIENLTIPKEFQRYAWFNLHFSDFHNHLRLFSKYVLLPNACTASSCPVMRERPESQYVWIYDDDGTPLPSIDIKLSGPKYLEKCVEVTGKVLESLIDAEEGGEIDLQPERNELLYKNMTRLIFQFYTHTLYWHHDAFARLSVVSHLNFCFRWFILFVHLYRLLNESEAEPLRYPIQRILDQRPDRESDPEESLSVYPESCSYRSSDDISKLTLPSSFDSRSNPSTLRS